ncbi:MAG: hypothetical protein ACREL9_05585 [Gemmatimonadales bacterium]
MQQGLWARLRGEVDVQLRRGGWYRVVRETPLEAVLDANGRQVNVPKSFLQIVSARPEVWTVVPRPPRSGRLPMTWGPRYAVCPNCRARAPLGKPVPSMRCPTCNGVFEIGWGDGYSS